MIARSGVRFGCNVHLQLFDKDGVLIDERFGHNLLPTVGLGHIADRLAAAPAQAVMGWMAVGTGASAPLPGDTLLGNEAARVALTSKTASGAVVTYVASYGAGTGTGALTEAGIFNNASAASGTMLARLTYAVINKGVNDTLQITWTLTASDDGV